MKKNMIFNVIKKLRIVLTKKQKWGIAVILLLIIISSLIELLGISAVMPFLQALLDTDKFMTNQYVEVFIDMFCITNKDMVILLCAILIVVVYILKNLILVFTEYIQIRYRCNLQKSLSLKLLETYMKQPYSYFIEINSSEILRSINGDASSIKGLVSSCFLVITDSLVTIFIALFLFSVDSILTIGFLLIVFVCVLIIFRNVNINSREMGKVLREADQNLFKTITEAIGGIKEFTVMDKRNILVEQYDNAFNKKNIAEKKYNFTVTYIPRLLEAVGVAGLIIVVELRMVIGIDINEFISSLAVFALAAFKILPTVSRLSQSITSVNYFYPALNAVCDTLNIVDVPNNNELNLESKDSLSFNSSVEMKGVYWKYNNAESYVLENADLTLNRNESVAIIGKSGSGKTTVADIFLGLLSPEKGKILLDGIDIKHNVKDWRRIIGYVPQTVYLYDDTIAHNIAFGVDESEIDMNLLESVVRKAQLEEFIMQLPEKLNTRIGERGIMLSGGQRQRIAIARALYRKPEILVLDEATSALDNETEKAVMDAIEKLQGSITIIIIAHRLSTINFCDRVYEVKDKEIKEISKEKIYSE